MHEDELGVSPDELGPNADEVLRFAGQLRGLRIADWRCVQADAPPVTHRWAPVLNAMKAAAAAANRTTMLKRAGFAAFRVFPWELGADGWEGTGLKPKVCSDCASIAAQAFAARDLLGPEQFRDLYGPFSRVLPLPGLERAPWLLSE